MVPPRTTGAHTHHLTAEKRKARWPPSEGSRRSILLDSATDHATPRLPRAVLRTPLRGAVGPPVPHEAPADPAPAPRRAGDGVGSDARRRPNRRAAPLRRPPRVGGPRRAP